MRPPTPIVSVQFSRSFPLPSLTLILDRKNNLSGNEKRLADSIREGGNPAPAPDVGWNLLREVAICRYFISFSLNLKQGSHAWQNDLIGKCTADKLGRGDIQAPAGIQITKSVINPCMAKRISPSNIEGNFFLSIRDCSGERVSERRLNRKC